VLEAAGDTLSAMVSVVDEPGIGIARFSVERYHQMIAAEILTSDDSLELYEGVLVEKMTEGPAHASHLALLARLLTLRLGMSDWMLRVQNPITTADSEPEPDLAIVRVDRYDQQHPGAADIAVVIEISDSSLARDRSTKQRIYAAASVRRYLIVNIGADVVEEFTDPVSDPEARYATTRTLTNGSVDLGPFEIDIADLLRPAG
jgi:Uma2 family endonuclease